MDRGYRPDSYVDTHPKPAKPKTKVSKVPVGVSPMVQLKDELKAVSSEKDMLAAELGFTQKELEEDIRKISALEREIAKLNVALRGALQAQDELERERALLKNQIADLQRSLEILTAERDDLVHQVTMLKARIADLESQLAAAAERERQTQMQLERERKEAEERYATLDRDSRATIDKQSGEISSLVSDRDALRARVADLEAQVARLEQSETELTRLNHQYQLQLQVVKVREAPVLFCSVSVSNVRMVCSARHSERKEQRLRRNNASFCNKCASL
jgi:chromosome segregation ATPase